MNWWQLLLGYIGAALFLAGLGTALLSERGDRLRWFTVAAAVYVPGCICVWALMGVLNGWWQMTAC